MNIFESTHIKLDLKHYPRTVFFFKEDKFWMGYNWKNKILWCRLEYFWEVLERENNWNYEEVQAFIKDQVEKHFKIKDVSIFSKHSKNHSEIERYLNEYF